MNTKLLLAKGAMIAMVFLALGCKKTTDDVEPEEPQGPQNYVLGVGITTSSGSGSSTTNYVIKADLSKGTVSPVGNGLTLVGYRDYSAGNKSLFAVGGFAEANVNVITQTQDDAATLSESGNAVFDAAVDDMQQVDASTMLALQYPAPAAAGDARFYFVDIASKAITSNYTISTSALKAGGDNPVYSGMAVSGNKLFVSYLHFNAGYATNHTDTNYVAVYSYPSLAFEKVIIDTRTGPTGSWATKHGLFTTENGDIYSVSSSNIANGYSQTTKPGGFLRIKNGETEFDDNYFFYTNRIAHLKYIGNGKVFATISTNPDQTADDRWLDKDLKMAIVDIYAKTVTYVSKEGGNSSDLIHAGNGGRSFPVLIDGGKVYYAATINGTTRIYEIDPVTAVAKPGAKVAATFVGGIFKLK